MIVPIVPESRPCYWAIAKNRQVLIILLIVHIPRDLKILRPCLPLRLRKAWQKTLSHCFHCLPPLLPSLTSVVIFPPRRQRHCLSLAAVECWRIST